MRNKDEIREKHEKVLARLKKFSHFTDSSIRIPFTKIEIGADGIVGLLPVFGDIAGAIFSVYILIEAHQAGASKSIKFKMLKNIGVDFIGGFLPVIGDVFDIFFKSNTRNTEILQCYLEEKLALPSPSFPWKSAMRIVIIIIALIIGLTFVL